MDTKIWTSLGTLILGSLLGRAAEQPQPPATGPAPGAPVASPTLLNSWLREQSSLFNPWDIGGQFRARYEIKEDAGSFPNRDFRREGVDNDNSYLLLRERIHLGY